MADDNPCANAVTVSKVRASRRSCRSRSCSLMNRDSDVYVLSGLLARNGAWSYRSLAERLRVPHTVVQRALERAKGSGLYSVDRREVHLPHFEEFALHALRFVAPARLGALTPGVPAAWAAEPMAGAIRSSGDEPPPVWPYAQGRVRGRAIEPLHSAVPEASEDWQGLSEILALLDSLRAGDARIRRVAGDLLSGRLRERTQRRVLRGFDVRRDIDGTPEEVREGRERP